jgi:hypothetical protein
MARWYQDTLTGYGEENVGFQSLHYFQVFFNQLGPGVGHPTSDFPDNLSKAGWLQFGNTFDAGDGTTRTYWRERIWINNVAFEQQFEPPIPANELRYWLSAGCQAYVTCED